MATTLSALLFTEAHRGRSTRGKGGTATVGLAVEIPVNVELAPFCVSSARIKGKFYFVDAHPGGFARVGMTPIRMEEEDGILADAVEAIFEYGEEARWANTVRVGEFPDLSAAVDEAFDYLKFFYGEESSDPSWRTPVHLICMSSATLRTMMKEEVTFHHPEKANVLLKKMPQGYQKLIEAYEPVARLRGAPVLVNDHLGKHIIFAPDRKFVGVLTRVSNHGAAILFHNLQRGLFLLRA